MSDALRGEVSEDSSYQCTHDVHLGLEGGFTLD